MGIDRRSFLAGLLAGGAGYGQLAPTTGRSVSGLPKLVNGSIVVSGNTTLPQPARSGIEHIVVVTMENRSFDHLLGWVIGADGKQANLSYADNHGASHSTHSLAPDYTGCGHPDPDHSYAPNRVAYNAGKMDGFLRAGANDVYSIGYYGPGDIPFYAALTQHYTVCDRYFASILGPTFPNRMFMWAAQTDRLDDSISFSSLPTIFDRLAAANVSHQYYFSNLPYLALWGFKYFFNSGPFSAFLSAASTGTLPAVSFVDPNYTIFDDGTGNDDHPHADIRNGDAFLSTVVHALLASPAWKNTVLIINFDEWGGFFEHVAPPRAIAPNNVDTDLVKNQALLGFRVPTVIVSPFTRNTGFFPRVSDVVFDHTSVLKLIEWRWSLPPLTARDASSQIGNPAVVMDFDSPVVAGPPLPAPAPVYSAPCFGGGIFSSSGLPSQRETSALRAEESDSPWAQLAKTQTVREWSDHPRFKPAK